MTFFARQRIQSRLWLPGLLVALSGLLTSVALWRQQQASVHAISEARIEQEIHSFSEALQLRLRSNIDLLNGMRMWFAMNPQIGQRDFARAVQELNLQDRHSGVSALRFVRYAPKNGSGGLEAGAPAAAVAGGVFNVRPNGQRAADDVFEYAWPSAAASGVGQNMVSRHADRDTFLRSRATGAVAASAPIEVGPVDRRVIAVEMCAPVFGRDPGAVSPAGDLPGDARSLIGAVGAVIQVPALVDALRSEGYLSGMLLGIQDVGLNAGASPARTSVVLPLEEGKPEAAQPYERMVQVGGRHWQLTFYPQHDFLSSSERRLPGLVGLGGVLATCLLAGLVVLLVRRRAQAQSQAVAAQSARTDSEERFRTVFNQAAVGVAQTRSSTGELVRVNQKFCDILGYSADELQSMRFHDYTHPDDLEVDLELTRRMVRGELAEFRLEKRYVRKNGEIVTVDLNVSPMRSRGAISDVHIAAVQDISARKSMEAALRDSEQRLREILNRIPVGVCLVQGDGAIVFRNERFTQICGYVEDETPDVRTWWAKLFPDAEHRAVARQRWRSQRQAGLRAGGDIPASEYTITCKDGQRRTVEGAGALLGDAHMLTLVDLSQHKADEEEIRYLAYYDPLTRLPNRRLLVDRLQQALDASARRQRCGALLMLDLDNFKTLNETRGHDRGDMLLREVAQRLRSCVGTEDTVARHGGDEFVVVLENLDENPPQAAARAEEIAKRILLELREPFVLDGQLHHSTLSIGLTVFKGQSESADELIKRGDLAMYQAKAAGRDRMRFYDPHMQAQVAARAALEVDMRAGLRQGQFELFYQPQVVQGRITGAEALLRWRHPQRGFVSPGEFIPLAEDCGLILPLGEWVLQDACARLAQWAQRPGLSHLSLSVNVSPREFHQSGFVAQVLQALASTGADARHLKLELTESLLLQDVEDTIDKMGQLRAYGVGFSLDDFGTGYSSLAYLKRLPLDELKIDQSFVRDVLTDPNDAAIARTIVALGTSLGLRVTAEGVETKEQRAFLERAHCHAWQGYLLSAPMVVVAFEHLVLARGDVPI